MQLQGDCHCASLTSLAFLQPCGCGCAVGRFRAPGPGARTGAGCGRPGYTQPTAVQEKAISGHGRGRRGGRFIDLMVSSQTGSGSDRGLPIFVLQYAGSSSRPRPMPPRAPSSNAPQSAAARRVAALKRPAQLTPTHPRILPAFAAPVAPWCRYCAPRASWQQCVDAIVSWSHRKGRASPTWWAACLTSCVDRQAAERQPGRRHVGARLDLQFACRSSSTRVPGGHCADRMLDLASGRTRLRSTVRRPSASRP